MAPSNRLLELFHWSRPCCVLNLIIDLEINCVLVDFLQSRSDALLRLSTLRMPMHCSLLLRPLWVILVPLCTPYSRALSLNLLLFKVFLGNLELLKLIHWLAHLRLMKSTCHSRRKSLLSSPRNPHPLTATP